MFATILNKYVFDNIQQLLFTSNNPLEAFKRDFIIHLEKDPDFLFEKKTASTREWLTGSSQGNLMGHISSLSIWADWGWPVLLLSDHFLGRLLTSEI